MPRPRPSWDYPRDTRHAACPGGCGELADECRCARPNPLGSMRVTALTAPRRNTVASPASAIPVAAPTPAPTRATSTLGAPMAAPAQADPFSAPAPSSGTNVNEFDGSLLLVTPTGYREEVTTIHGVKDAVEADVSVLDGPRAGEEHPNLLLFQAMLIAQTKPMVGQGMVLGRLGKRPAAPGKNPAWALSDPTEADKVVARKHLAAAKAKAAADPWAEEAPF